MKNPHAIVVFCDGAAKGNPGPGGWGAVIATPGGRVRELGGRSAHTTNNKMELTAAIRGLSAIRDQEGAVEIYTDSVYVINGIREWIWGWRRRGWKTADGGDVQNQDLWQELDGLAAPRGRSLSWHHVRGHVGIPGNERVDSIADGLARGQDVRLYDGPLDAYEIAIFDVPDDTSVPKRSPRSASAGKSTKAFSYVSVLNGQPMRHATWADCEARVKGQRGALFKKSASAEDERTILRGWKIDPDSL